MTKPFDYKRALSASQTAVGINAAAVNARRLAEDAKLLFDAGRFPSAASLALLAFEEFGKTNILRELLLASDSEKDLAKHWKRYRSHTEKNFFALLPSRISSGASKLDDVRELFTDESESARATYDGLKQRGFYTDCCSSGSWAIPTEVIFEKLGHYFVRFATLLTNEIKPVTVEKMELWKFHMGSGRTQENLLKWDSAMVGAGLERPEFVKKMRHFTNPANIRT